MNIFRFSDRVGVVDERSRRFFTCGGQLARRRSAQPHRADTIPFFRSHYPFPFGHPSALSIRFFSTNPGFVANTCQRSEESQTSSREIP